MSYLYVPDCDYHTMLLIRICAVGEVECLQRQFSEATVAYDRRAAALEEKILTLKACPCQIPCVMCSPAHIQLSLLSECAHPAHWPCAETTGRRLAGVQYEGPGSHDSSR